MKKVRMLLRVSSNQQLEADGDLSVQRQLVREYIESHKDLWAINHREICFLRLRMAAIVCLHWVV